MTKMATIFSTACILAACASGVVLTSDYSEKKECLALNVYHEARGESIEGQYAVAHVTMNRVTDRRWADNICDVVYQRKQFSWTHTISDPTPKEKRAWKTAQEVARRTLDGTAPDNTGNATHYHADYVTPAWANEYEKVSKIGIHIFYR